MPETASLVAHAFSGDRDDPAHIPEFALVAGQHWETYESENGRRYYFHRGSSRVSWKLPAGCVAAPPQKLRDEVVDHAAIRREKASPEVPHAPSFENFSRPFSARAALDREDRGNAASDHFTNAGSDPSRVVSGDEVQERVASDRVTSARGVSPRPDPVRLAREHPAATSPVPSKRPRTSASLAPSGVSAPARVAPSAGNALLAEIFEEMGAIQKLKRDRFRARAYEKAAAALRGHPEVILSGSQAKAIDGIGAGMARRIDIVFETGELEELAVLKRDEDVVALRDLRAVHGIGAVRAADLVEKGIRSLAALRDAVSTGAVRLDAAQTVGLKHVDDLKQKIPRAEMLEHQARLLRAKETMDPRMSLTICGSFRRGKAECGDIDALITFPDVAGRSLLSRFVDLLRGTGYVTDTLAAGASKFMGVCRLGPTWQHRRLDVRFIPIEQFHYGTLYFTGSAGTNLRMRLKAIELGMTLSEYSLERKSDGSRVPANSERNIFEALGMDFLDPHER